MASSKLDCIIKKKAFKRKQERKEKKEKKSEMHGCTVPGSCKPSRFAYLQEFEMADAADDGSIQ